MSILVKLKKKSNYSIEHSAPIAVNSSFNFSTSGLGASFRTTAGKDSTNFFAYKINNNLVT